MGRFTQPLLRGERIARRVLSALEYRAHRRCNIRRGRDLDAPNPACYK